MKEKLKMILENKKILIEIILISAIFILSLSLYLVYNFTAEEGNTAVVSVSGVTVAEYSLSKDGEYLINGYNGGTNLLVIEDGKAYVKEASCPQYTGSGACVYQGKISLVGQTIICIPNRVIIEIVGELEGDDPLI